MRDYSKISPQFWLCDMGRKLKTMGPETQLIALYLMSSPHSTMVGIYYLPYLLMAHETGLSQETVQAAMHSLIELQFCSYDETYEYVWVHDMARCQIAPQLKPNDNRVKSVNKFLMQLPKLHFIPAFYQQYREDFHLCVPEFRDSISKKVDEIYPQAKASNEKSIDIPAAPSLIQVENEPLLRESNEPILEIEAPEEKIIPQETRFALPQGASAGMLVAVQFVFEEWKKLTHQPDAELTQALFDLMNRPLINGFTTEDLTHAMRVCVTRNPQASNADLEFLLSQRAHLEAALRTKPTAHNGQAIANQFLHQLGVPHGAKPTSVF